MPTYVYQCSQCKTEIECVHRMSEQGPSDCAACGAVDMRKIITNSNFVLKGQGWYHDGYGLKTTDSSNKQGE